MTNQVDNRKNRERDQGDAPRNRTFRDHSCDLIFSRIVIADSVPGIGEIVVDKEEH